MILALSPHLDDVVFSCGGWLAATPGPKLVATIFTAEVAAPTGFALDCQTSKGLAPEVNYMKLRKAEDRDATALLGAGYEHWPLAEAPHRGYDCPEALFVGIRDDDRTSVDEITERIAHCLDRHRPSTVLYPYGAGNHVDHLLTIAAVDRLRADYAHIVWLRYFDQPYTVKAGLAYALHTARADAYQPSEEALQTKIAAARAYRSQLGFQFGGYEAVPAVLGTTEWFER